MGLGGNMEGVSTQGAWMNVSVCDHERNMYSINHHQIIIYQSIQ